MRVPPPGASLAVSVLQSEGVPGQAERNLALLEEACAGCARAGDRLLVTPELFVSGYHIGDDVAALAVPRDGALVARVADVARRHGVGLCVGYPEREGGSVYNTAVLVDAGGVVLGHYRKHRLSGPFENAAFTRGDGADLVAVMDGITVGVLICYDVEFPENVRRLALAGVKLLLAPTALSEEFAVVAEKLIPTRAFENGIFIAYADHCASERGMRYAGGSCIVAPDGADLVRAGPGAMVLRADVEPWRYAALAQRLPYLRDVAAG